MHAAELNSPWSVQDLLPCVGTGGSFPRGGVAGAWNWPLTSS